MISPSPGPDPFRCADAARERADPQLGSAPQHRRWLLLEHPGPWPVDAVAGSQIAPDVLDLLSRTALAEGARPLLIRRPGRARRPTRSWAVVYAEGLACWGSWSADEDLGAAAVALAADAPPAGAVADPILLVCAHGVHDVCCALRGRPVAAALAREWPEATWECSHVGGDRFAANLVMLPDGVYYGNLDAASAVATVSRHLDGTVALEHLRGMAWAPPPSQVALAAVHERFGPFAARAVTVVDERHTSVGHWQVDLAGPTPALARIRALVASGRRAPAQLTCRAPRETPAAHYVVLDLRVL